MAAAAEQIRHQTFEPQLETGQRPLVLVVPEMVEDQFTCHQANRFIGSVALNHEVNFVSEEQPKGPQSTMEAIRMAADGDEMADKMLDINITTDTVERAIKAGIVLDVELKVDAQKEISQNGQYLRSIHSNGLRYASGNDKMRSRSESEARNAFRITQLNKQNWLDNYNFVTFSRAADNMTLQELKDNKFFVETMSCAIQVTGASEAGLKMESAFVAGIKEDEEERHDAWAIVRLAAHFGVDYSGMSAAEILDTPLLIHKKLMPNGAVDLVKLYDEIVGDSFFGQNNIDKPIQDYVAYKALCQQRIASFASRVKAIKQELIAEANSIDTPLQAVERLDKLSQKHMVLQAVKDSSIDARVFGPAAIYIEQARLHEHLGNHELAKAATNRAQSVAKSSACPNGRPVHETDGESDSKSVNDGKFVKMKCPFCGDKNQYGKACSPNQHCKKCDARVIGGRITDTGNGGKKTDESLEEPNANEEPERQLAQVISIEEVRRRNQPEAPLPVLGQTVSIATAA